MNSEQEISLSSGRIKIRLSTGLLKKERRTVLGDFVKRVITVRVGPGSKRKRCWVK